MKGLLIRTPWIDMILAGTKTWEMRSGQTHIRGRIALIRAGSGLIVGSAELVDSLPALSLEQMRTTQGLHGIPDSQIAGAFNAGWITPWVLRDVRALATPKPYRHKSGAVTWIELADDEECRPMSTPSPKVVMPESAPGAAMQTAVVRPAKPDVPRRFDATITWVDIPITGGNLRHHHFYLRAASALLPADCIGGSNKSELGRPIRVRFDPGRVLDCDVAGDKMILRSRAETRDFYERSGAVEGDTIRFSRVAAREFVVTLRRIAEGR